MPSFLASQRLKLIQKSHSNCLCGINCQWRLYLRFSACWSLINTIWYIIYTAPSLFLASLSITVCMSSIACKMLSLCMLQHVSIICHLPWMVTLLPIICLPQAKQNVQNRKIWGRTLCWYMVYGEKKDGLAILSYHVWSNTLHLHACCISIITISLSRIRY